MLFDLEGCDLSELAADMGLKTSLHFCSPVQTAVGEEAVQFIFYFSSSDLILLVQGAALELGGLDTEKKEFKMWGMLKFADKWQVWQQFGVMIWQIISAYSKQCVLSRMVLTGNMENMCPENKEATHTKIKEKHKAFTASLPQIRSRELVL